MTFRAPSLGLLATLMLGGRLAAAELGDPAPPLQISEWVKGQPVDLAEGKGKRIHVIAFWATTYGPIRTSIAFLTELQRKFKDQDVVIVGICKDKPDVARKFVDQMGDKMDYTVAIEKGRATGDGYMKAFGANTIPHAFVVDKEGKFAWQGHPMGDLEVTLQEMLAGKHTLERAKQRARGRTLLEEYFRMVQQNQSGPKVDETVKELTGLGQAGFLPEGKPFDPAQTQRRVRFQALSNEYRQALTADADAAKLDALARELGEVAPPEFKLEEYRETQLLQL
jgi:peroxiredoxin